MTFTATIDAEVTPVLSYAMAHNAIPFITDLVVTSASTDRAGAVVSIEVRDSEGVVSRPWQRLVDLAEGEATRLIDVRPLLDPAALLQVDERRPAQVVVTVTSGDEVIGERTFDVSLLAGHQWLADPLELGAELMVFTTSWTRPDPQPACCGLWGRTPCRSVPVGLSESCPRRPDQPERRWTGRQWRRRTPGVQKTALRPSH